MINSLEFVKTFVKVGLAAAAAPEDVPLVALSVSKVIGFTQASDKLGIALQNLVK